MHGAALGAYQVGHHYVEYRRRGAQADRPEHVPVRGVKGVLVGAEQVQQRGAENKAQQAEQQPADKRAVEAERAALCHGVVVLAAQRAAHQTGGADAEQVVDRVERQHERGGKSDSGVLYGVLEQTDKVSVRQIVQYGDKRADNSRYRKRHNSLAQRRFFKQVCLCAKFLQLTHLQRF